VLDTIWPSFFLFRLRPGEKLGVSIYEERVNRKKQDALKHYGPTTWAENGSWGYRPIYMLKHIIRLQSVVEIITDETAKALNILTKQ
jgi:hypothetical protein